MKKEAVENLFKKYYNEAKLYVLSLCHDVNLAEDIVSDAFYKAFVSIDEERDSFKYWLLRVCRNCYIDYLRKNKRTTPLTDEGKTDGDLAENLIKAEEYRALYRALATLQPNYKEVIVLYYFEGMSVKEIAEITEETVDNVKVQMFRARQKLKTILEAKI
jgi:RNA polymerase sigma-70 factor (ECF subfamily)